MTGWHVLIAVVAVVVITFGVALVFAGIVESLLDGADL